MVDVHFVDCPLPAVNLKEPLVTNYLIPFLNLYLCYSDGK